MKVLHLKYKDGLGGAESILLMLAAWERMRERVCEGVCEQARPGGERLVENHFIINVDGVLTARLRRYTPNVHAIPFDLSGLAPLRAYIREHRIDVLHAHGARANLFCALGAAGLGAPTVTTEHSAGDRFREKWLLNALDRLAGRRNRKRIAVSEAARATLLKGRIVPDSKIVVIPSGVDTVRFCPGESGKAVRAQLDLENKLVVTNVGRLAPEKGQSFFIRAAAGIVRRRDDAIFLIVGDGPLRADLEKLAAELALGARLRFLGMRDDVPDILRATDVFCLSSLWEGLPVSLLEAMATGCACVATRVAGVPQVLTDGVTGSLVEPGSVESLVEGLAAALADPEGMKTMGRNACELVRRRYSMDRMIEGYIAVYEEVLADAVCGPRFSGRL